MSTSTLIIVSLVFFVVLISVPVHASSAWSSNNNIELYEQNAPYPYWASSYWDFLSQITVSDSKANCHCFSVQLNLFDQYTNIWAQDSIQVYSTYVAASVYIGYDTSGSGCPAGGTGTNQWCVFVDTGISPSTVLAGGILKVAWYSQDYNDITGAYYVIWNNNGAIVYEQTIGGWKLHDNTGEWTHEGDVLGLGGGSKATFTSTNGFSETATDSGTMSWTSWPLLSNTAETSNMCYSSNVYFGGDYADQNFNSGC